MTREEAIEYLEMVRCDYDVFYKDSPVRESLNMAIEALKEEPRPTGHFEEVSNMWGDTLWRCDRCGVEWICECTSEEYGVYYCPNCGARREA